MQSSSIVVSGASGKLGRLVIAQLAARRASPIVAVSRNPESIADLGPKGIEIRRGDFDDPSGLGEAFAGASRILIISTNVLGPDGRRVRQHENAIRAAVTANVAHIVYTSILHASTSPLAAMASDHAATERMLADLAPSFTVLRNAFYLDMALAILQRARADATVPFASGAAGVAYITREDCAIAAAAALMTDFVGQRILEVTGQDVVAVPRLVQMANRLNHSALTALPVSIEELGARLKASGLPPAMAGMFAALDAGIATGAMQPATEDFKTLTNQIPEAVELALRRYLAAR